MMKTANKSEIGEIYGRCAAVQGDSIAMVRGMTVKTRNLDEMTKHFVGNLSQLVSENTALKVQLCDMTLLKDRMKRIVEKSEIYATSATSARQKIDQLYRYIVCLQAALCATTRMRNRCDQQVMPDTLHDVTEAAAPLDAPFRVSPLLPNEHIQSDVQIPSNNVKLADTANEIAGGLLGDDSKSNQAIRLLAATGLDTTLQEQRHDRQCLRQTIRTDLDNTPTQDFPPEPLLPPSQVPTAPVIEATTGGDMGHCDLCFGSGWRADDTGCVDRICSCCCDDRRDCNGGGDNDDGNESRNCCDEMGDDSVTGVTAREIGDGNKHGDSDGSCICGGKSNSDFDGIGGGERVASREEKSDIQHSQQPRPNTLQSSLHSAPVPCSSRYARGASMVLDSSHLVGSPGPLRMSKSPAYGDMLEGQYTSGGASLALGHKTNPSSCSQFDSHTTTSASTPSTPFASSNTSINSSTRVKHPTRPVRNVICRSLQRVNCELSSEGSGDCPRNKESGGGVATGYPYFPQDDVHKKEHGGNFTAAIGEDICDDLSNDLSGMEWMVSDGKSATTKVISSEKSLNTSMITSAEDGINMATLTTDSNGLHSSKSHMARYGHDDKKFGSNVDASSNCVKDNDYVKKCREEEMSLPATPSTTLPSTVTSTSTSSTNDPQIHAVFKPFRRRNLSNRHDAVQNADYPTRKASVPTKIPPSAAALPKSISPSLVEFTNALIIPPVTAGTAISTTAATAGSASANDVNGDASATATLPSARTAEFSTEILSAPVPCPASSRHGKRMIKGLAHSSSHSHPDVLSSSEGVGGDGNAVPTTTIPIMQPEMTAPPCPIATSPAIYTPVRSDISSIVSSSGCSGGTSSGESGVSDSHYTATTTTSTRASVTTTTPTVAVTAKECVSGGDILTDHHKRLGGTNSDVNCGNMLPSLTNILAAEKRGRHFRGVKEGNDLSKHGLINYHTSPQQQQHSQLQLHQVKLMSVDTTPCCSDACQNRSSGRKAVVGPYFQRSMDHRGTIPPSVIDQHNTRGVGMKLPQTVHTLSPVYIPSPSTAASPQCTAAAENVVEIYWEFDFNSRGDVFDSDPFAFAGSMWRLTFQRNGIGATPSQSGAMSYGLMISHISRQLDADYAVRIRCDFRLHCDLRTPYAVSLDTVGRQGRGVTGQHFNGGQRTTSSSRGKDGGGAAEDGCYVFSPSLPASRGHQHFIGPEVMRYVKNGKLTVSVRVIIMA